MPLVIFYRQIRGRRKTVPILPEVRRENDRGSIDDEEREEEAE